MYKSFAISRVPTCTFIFEVIMHCPFQIAESQSLFQSLGSMWHRCIKTRTKDLCWSIMYVVCTYCIYITWFFSLVAHSVSQSNPKLPLRLLKSLAIKLETDL